MGFEPTTSEYTARDSGRLSYATMGTAVALEASQHDQPELTHGLTVASEGLPVPRQSQSGVVTRRLTVPGSRADPIPECEQVIGDCFH